ncbi:ABC transporter permease [Dactylosporangium matsuzakiense]|uniref:Choline transport system permease protein OpuBB n=1 Tax=Dactylosporangium matsuzakiense TaxID=53360 RepID=A0A9W6NNT8_9ACTN|nr:ABC transporter permease [Dactylosporangium matsuzakiense]UWZ45496.1 ABC transporter permease [Dactylosporangium matsuzakiense]GLL04345.1 choline transport system permease protein OpuBB [Dactylosporangium matsuzakiense]
MSVINDALVWFNDPLNWTNPDGVLDRLTEHIEISAGAVVLGCLVAWPLGILLGRRGAASGVIVLLSNLTQAVPVIALLTILTLTPIGLGKPAVIIALAVFALPALLANAYTGMRQIDPEVRDAAKGVGMTSLQRLVRVELPLAVPFLATGLRIATTTVVATATLATAVNGGGLGMIISAGFGLGPGHGGQILAGAILVAGLALIIDGVMAIIERKLTPKVLRRAAGRV